MFIIMSMKENHGLERDPIHGMTMIVMKMGILLDIVLLRKRHEANLNCMSA